MPHSSAPVGGRFGRVEALLFDLVERNPIIEAVTRFRENVELRFDGFSCGGFGGAAAAIWLEERKSENEDGVCGACSVFCSAEVKTGRGPPGSVELRGLSIMALARSYIIPMSQRYSTDSILPNFIVVRSKAMPHGRIDWINRT